MPNGSMRPRRRDPELELAMFQFEVVCKIAIQTRSMSIGGRGADRVNLLDIAVVQFGLTRGQCRICIGRAQSLLAEVEMKEIERVRSGDGLRAAA